MALAELAKSFIVEPTVITATPGPSTDDWPEDIPPYTAVPDFMAGAMDVWYGVEYKELFEECFISTPSLTSLFDEWMDVYASGDYLKFLEINSRITLFFEDQFTPCLDNYYIK